MQLVAQAAMALSYLHGLPRPIIHGDIKATNILINDNLEASLSDFGLSRILEVSGFTTTTASGTIRWLAYELLVAEERPIPRVTKATDVWAFAMTVIEILTARIPFLHLKSDASVVLFVTSGGRPLRHHSPQINDQIWAMLERCWNIDPTQRPSMAILAHFFASQLTSPSQQLHGVA